MFGGDKVTMIDDDSAISVVTVDGWQRAMIELKH